MTAPPMRPWQNLIALAGATLAGVALLPIDARARIACCALAAAIAVAAMGGRLRAHRARHAGRRIDDVQARIARIRGQRRGRGR